MNNNDVEDAIIVSEETITPAQTVDNPQVFRDNYPGMPGEMLASISEELGKSAPDFLTDVVYAIDVVEEPVGDVKRSVTIAVRSKALEAQGMIKPVLTATFQSSSQDLGYGLWKELQARQVRDRVIATRLSHHFGKFEQAGADQRYIALASGMVSYLCQHHQYQLASCSKPSIEKFSVDVVKRDGDYDHVRIDIQLINLLGEEPRKKLLKKHKS
jgi:hypothetical protein